MNNIAIYGLHDETRIRYVGRTESLLERFTMHGNFFPWLVGVLVLEWVSEANMVEREKYWITHFGLSNLENKRITSAGLRVGQVSRSEETRQKISDTKRAQNLVCSPKQKEAVRDANYRRAEGGSYFTEKGLQTIKEKLKGNKARTGQPHSEETKAKMSVAAKAAWAKRKQESK